MNYWTTKVRQISQSVWYYPITVPSYSYREILGLFKGLGGDCKK